VEQNRLPASPFILSAAAISVGILNGQVVLDLDYAEDSSAEVDLNVVALENGGLVEVQGTAERAPFSHNQLLEMVGLATRGIDQLLEVQRRYR
jgi:ribonuclease PH